MCFSAHRDRFFRIKFFPFRINLFFGLNGQPVYHTNVPVTQPFKDIALKFAAILHI